MRQSLMLCACAFAFPTLALATPLVVSSSGSFVAGTPSSAFSLPGSTYSFAFDVDSNPVLLGYDTAAGLAFSPVVSNFMYLLDGLPAATVDAPAVRFDAGGALGLFDLCLDAGCDASFEFEGAQAFSGEVSAPTSW